jgi:hypothetical protein
MNPVHTFTAYFSKIVSVVFLLRLFSCIFKRMTRQETRWLVEPDSSLRVYSDLVALAAVTATRSCLAAFFLPEGGICPLTQAWMPALASILRFPQMIYEYGERRCNDIDRGKPKNSEKNLFQPWHCPCSRYSGQSPNFTSSSRLSTAAGGVKTLSLCQCCNETHFPCNPQRV